jgi:two-component system sensor histidine kinase PilS (NtrC family)
VTTVELAAPTSGSGGLSSSTGQERSPGARVSHQTDAEILFGQLQWSMLLRLVAVSILFGIVIIMRLRGQGPVDLLAALYPLFMALYAVSGLYAVVAKRMPNLVFFAYLQFAVDAACIGLVLIYTGGSDSTFTWLFVFNVLGAGYLLQLRGGLAVATLDTIAYLSCLGLTWTGLVPVWGPNGEPVTMSFPMTGDMVEVFSTVGFHIVSFYLLAFLSGSLARKQLVTGRVLAETASNLQRLQDMHGRIVQNLDSGLLTVDSEGRITSFNRAAEKLTRYMASEVLTQPVESILRGVNRLLAATAGDGASAPTGHTFERWMTRKDKKRIYLRVAASVMRDADGTTDGHILVFEDRTRMLLMEEQLEREERLAAVGRLSAAIAHEIRNPLASITGSVQVLRSDLELSNEDDELLGIVERESNRLGHLVSDFLHLTREESPDLEPGKMGLLIRETFALLENKADDQGVKMESLLDYDPVLLLDGARMRQVLWNLVNNAFQAMTAGGRLRIVTERVTRDDLGGDSMAELPSTGEWAAVSGEAERKDWLELGPGEGALRLLIEDSGPGIPDEDLTRVFDPFYTTRSGGTGLGLAIVARIVQAHRGIITVQSQPGDGTTFAIWLPIDDEGDVEAFVETVIIEDDEEFEGS